MSRPEAGEVREVAPGVRCILAPNPGPMTHHGTNTWIFGEDRVAVIDPGPNDPAHLRALQSALAGETVTHILVTHAHADHSPLARDLSMATGAPVHGYGRFDAGRSEVMGRLASDGAIAGGEGVDAEFAPDVLIADGDRILGDGWSLDVLHTPGHFAGHLAFLAEGALFSGDHVMDWSTTLVSPPDGDLSAFMRTSARLAALPLDVCFTGHGQAISNPSERLEILMTHRRVRARQIQDALTDGPRTIPEITARVYTDTPSNLHVAASRNVLAHLIELAENNVVEAIPTISLDALYRLR